MYQRDLEIFIECLRHATSRIEQQYLRLPIYGRKQPSYRERVYCYELYHQLRCCLPPKFPYALCGEIDKAGHPVIRQGVPDLVVNVPGDMSSNLAVVEVKPINGRSDGIRKDLDTLAKFVTKRPAYKSGVYLVYGPSQQGIKRFVHECRTRLDRKPFALTLMWHASPGESAQLVPLEPCGF